MSTADDMATVSVTVGDLDRVATAWLVRFGRTAAEQTVAGIRTRLSAPRRTGVEASLAGHNLPSWASGSDEGGFGPGVRSGPAAASPEAETFPMAFPSDAAAPQSWSMSELDLLAGSRLALVRRTADGGLAGMWLRGAVSGFDGRDGSSLTLDGTVSTVQAGADYSRGPLTVGLSAAFSHGGGEWSGEGAGETEAGVTGVYPYLGWRPDERLSLWATAGWGQGTLKLTPEEGGGAERTRFDLGLAAAGMRGQLVAPDPARDNFALAAVLDGLWVRTDPEKIGTTARSTRLRLGLEASWQFALDDGTVLTPSLELAARHDGGDAGAGTGVEVGGGIIYADPLSGLTMELSGRTLASHAESGYREWSVGGLVSFDPGADGLGLSLRLAPSRGTASGGGERLWVDGAGELSGLAAGGRAANDNAAETRLDTELGYGVSTLGGRGVLTPYGALSLSEGDARDYRLGTRLEIGPSLDLGLEGMQSESDGAEAEHNIGFRLRASW